jgi:hypothetical protein
MNLREVPEREIDCSITAKQTNQAAKHVKHL